MHGYILCFSYAFKVCSKSVSEILYIHPVIVDRAVITHEMFDARTKHLSATDGQLKIFLSPSGWRSSIFKVQSSCTFTSVTTSNPPKCIIDTTDIHLMFLILIFSVNGLLKSNWRNSLSSLVGLWAILLQDIDIKWWLLLVPGTVFDLAKRSSRSA